MNVENDLREQIVTVIPSVEEKREEIRREDKKAKKKFVVILFASGLCGMLLGVLGVVFVSYMKSMKWDFLAFSEVISGIWVEAGRYLLIGVNMIVLPLMWISFSKQRKALKAWDGEEEAVYECLDKKLSVWMTVSSGIMIFDMLTYGIAFYGSVEIIPLKKVIFLVDLIFFIGSMACIILYQKALVNLTKELKPEKKGSVYDTKFKKKWLESCDEAEKQKIGEVSYATYSFMNTVYEVVSMFFMIAGFFFPIGVLPLTIVCLLWITQVIFYSVKAR